MNERVMQFRIGMFVIVAGLVLTMMIVWFGESPALLRDHSYVIVRFDEAPGVADGIPVRKSGIRVGEVSGIRFEDRPGQPDGVLVTLSLERRFPIKEGTVPRISRSLMGDASIELLPGTGPGRLKTSESLRDAPVIEGTVAVDPSKALAAATMTFDKVGETLKSIQGAAAGIDKATKKLENVDEFLATWSQTGKRVSSAADGIDRFIKANENDFAPAVSNLKAVSQKLNSTLDAATQDSLKSGIKQFASASAELSVALKNAGPLFKDAGSPVSSTPTTDFGQALRRLNLITTDLGLLTQTLRDHKGGLNTEGSLQRLLTRADLYDNVNRLAVSGSQAFEGVKPIIASFRVFAEKIARDPSSLAKGALQRQ
jgi:phospholipid/cholesterol/gamma-HCH transport system substrate-binding protein